MNNFDPINDALDIESTPVESKIEKKKETGKLNKNGDIPEIRRDYEYTRAQLYSLIEKGQEAIDGILEVSQQSDSPRAYEVAGQLIKSVADTADKLMDLQKKLKDVERDDPKVTTNVTNNAVFVGSTSELQKLLKQGLKDNKSK
jgi:hypothetical protein